MIMRKINSQKGVTLIEILVALMIVAIGSLGIAAMQLTGLKYSSGAAVRTQATLLANDLMDRMRANRATAVDRTIYATEGFQGADTSARPTPNCYSSVCDGNEMARYDKWAWLNQVSSLMPDGKAEIRIDEADGNRVYAVTMQWRQVANAERGDAEDEIQQFTFIGSL